jgi:outer membrane protein assembly factor BamB
VGPGFVIVTNGYRGVQPIFAIKPGGTGDITLKEGQTQGGTIAWSSTRGGPYIPTPVIYGEHLYVLQNNGVLAAYKAATGERLYQQRVGDGGAFSASPVAADGKIYCLSEDGDTFVVKAGPEFQVLGKNSLDEMCLATPALVRDSILIRTQTRLYRIAQPSSARPR